jgi:hypothetical protein
MGGLRWLTIVLYERIQARNMRLKLRTPRENLNDRQVFEGDQLKVR